MFFNYPGQIQDIWKEGVSNLRNSASVGARGVKAKKKCKFQSQFTQFHAFFLPEVHTQRRPISAKKKKWAHAASAPF